MTKYIDLTGKKFGLLTVIEYSHPHPGGSMWLVECVCGEQKVSASRDLRNGCILTCGIKGRHPRPYNPNRYHAIHVNLQNARGKASAHPCTDCGGPAREWSWSGKGECTDDYDLFQPRCRPCHLVFDGRQAVSA